MLALGAAVGLPQPTSYDLIQDARLTTLEACAQLRDDDLAAYCFPRPASATWTTPPPTPSQGGGETATPPPTNTPRPSPTISATLTTIPLQPSATPTLYDPMPQTPTPELTPLPVAECYRVNVVSVRVRENPGTGFKEVGGLAFNDIVEVSGAPAAANGYTWRKVERLIWPSRSWFNSGWSAFGAGWFVRVDCNHPLAPSQGGGISAPQAVAYSGGGHAIPITATPLYYSTPVLVPPGG